MKKQSSYIYWFLIVIGAFFFVSLQIKAQQDAAPAMRDNVRSDSINLRFPVAPTQPETIDDINAERPLDLKSPENVKSEVEYDVNTGRYLLKTKMGDEELGTSFSLSPEEYMDQDMRRSLHY